MEGVSHRKLALAEVAPPGSFGGLGLRVANCEAVARTVTPTVLQSIRHRALSAPARRHVGLAGHRPHIPERPLSRRKTKRSLVWKRSNARNADFWIGP